MLNNKLEIISVVPVFIPVNGKIDKIEIITVYMLDS
jgi:hypothetical protein